MSQTMTPCRRVDTDYFDHAPIRIETTVEIDADAADVFAALEDAHAWPRFAPAITQVEWTSAKPFGLGTTRTVHMVGGMMADEVFIAWEDQVRMAFCFTAATTPTEVFAEDYQVTPAGPGRVRLTWVMAITPRGVAKYTMPLFKPGMARFNAWLMKRLAQLVVREYRGKGRAPVASSAA